MAISSGNYKPMDPIKKAAIVARGEVKLGKQHFVGFGAEETIHRHIETKIVEDIVETISYDKEYKTAVEFLKTIGEYKGDRN